MTSRVRVYAAMNHREPDSVPICFGGTAASGIEECPPDYWYRAAIRLYGYLGLKDAEPVEISPVGNIVGNIGEEHKVWPFLYGMRIKKCGIYDMIDMTNLPWPT